MSSDKMDLSQTLSPDVDVDKCCQKCKDKKNQYYFPEFKPKKHNCESKKIHCGICGSSFTRENNRSKHMRNLHEGKTPFKGYMVFVEKSSITRQMETHDPDRSDNETKKTTTLPPKKRQRNA